MSKSLKYILMGLIALILVVVSMIIYRMFFQFKASDIKAYINDEAVKYKDKDAVAEIIHDAVEYILSSHNLTQQVLKSARSTNTDKEQELVNAAIMQCKAFNYLPK